MRLFNFIHSVSKVVNVSGFLPVDFCDALPVLLAVHVCGLLLSASSWVTS